jgi:hypothetical protein
MSCFKNPPSKWNHKTEGFQYAPLQIVFNAKSSLKRKACLVCGSNVIQCHLNMYASTVKTLSICLLHIIAIANKLEILCGDVRNAFVNAYMNEKVWKLNNLVPLTLISMTTILFKCLLSSCQKM